MTDRPVIALAGAGGDLGGRIAKALAARGAGVRALVRPGLKADERVRIAALGVTPVPADPANVDDMAGAITGAACVVSALNGVRDVMIGRQGVLLDAAVQAGVPRFIPSDYAADFTTTAPGRNRNFDLRREFMARVDAAPIKATTVLNGAFLDMLGAEMPIIQPRIRRVLYWHDGDQLLDFTTKDDVAAYTAEAALDDTTPRVLRIAGDSVSARDIAATMTSVSGTALPAIMGGNARFARDNDSRRQAGRAAARCCVSALAGHAVHARPVQRSRSVLAPSITVGIPASTGPRSGSTSP